MLCMEVTPDGATRATCYHFASAPARFVRCLAHAMVAWCVCHVLLRALHTSRSQPVKKAAPKKPVKKVVKKAAKKSDFRPGQQMPANQAITELLGGFGNALDLLRNLPK